MSHPRESGPNRNDTDNEPHSSFGFLLLRQTPFAYPATRPCPAAIQAKLAWPAARPTPRPNIFNSGDEGRCNQLDVTLGRPRFVLVRLGFFLVRRGQGHPNERRHAVYYNNVNRA